MLWQLWAQDEARDLAGKCEASRAGEKTTAENLTRAVEEATIVQVRTGQRFEDVRVRVRLGLLMFLPAPLERGPTLSIPVSNTLNAGWFPIEA